MDGCLDLVSLGPSTGRVTECQLYILESWENLAIIGLLKTEITTLQQAASQAIEQAEVVRLSMANQACVAGAILTTPSPNHAMERAFVHRGRLLQPE